MEKARVPPGERDGPATQFIPASDCVLGIAGIVVWHLQARARLTGRLIVQIAFFLAMTGVFVYARINPLRFDPTYINETQTGFISLGQ